MAILQTIENDYKAAFKAHHQATIDALRLLKSALKNAEIEARRELTDPEIQQVLTKEAKRRREAMALFTQGGRPDLVAKEQAELDEIARYLPPQLDDGQLDTVISQTIAELKATAKDFGRVMSTVMSKISGQADGGRVSAAVKRLLV